MAENPKKEYNGVIAISYTKKASQNLNERTLALGRGVRNSFFGTIHRFFFSEIIQPFFSFVFAPFHELKILELRELADKEKAALMQLHHEQHSINTFPEQGWDLLLRYGKVGYVILEFFGLYALKIISSSQACRNYLKARFTHIFIDEYQDADKYINEFFLQMVDIGMVGTAVGDSNQSIFGFDHKDSKYLIGLTQDKRFKNFRLTQNHRSHNSIINYSNRLLDPNAELLDNSESRVFGFKIIGDEATVCEFIDKFSSIICEKYGIENNSKIAILVKDRNTQKWIDANLKSPHKVINSTPLDNDINPRAHLFARLLSMYFDSTINFITIIEEFKDYENLSDKDKKALFKFKDFIVSRNEENLIEAKDAFIGIAKIVLPEIDNGNSIQNLEVVLENEISRNTYKPISDEEIVIMTLHKSKGLEFDLVFHLNLHDWVLPSRNSNGHMNYDQDLNLHYVGITRAKKLCILITNTKRHNNRDEEKDGNPSEFLTLNNVNELRDDYIWPSSE